jgi:N-acetyl-gamma-glutamyl-phosphate reductase
MGKIKAGIINVTGYAGVELARLLYNHPDVTIAAVTGRSAAGQKLADVFPHLADTGLTITKEIEESVDIAFSAMPQKESAEVLIPLVKKGVRVIDIAADFRLKDPALYPQWYQFNHPQPELLAESVYGLPEIYRKQIKTARIIANPGCYPTSALLALAPLVKGNMIEPDIIIDSKSGVSGAGRSLTMNTHFAEAADNVNAYSIEGHRHLPEITQELNFMSIVFSASVIFLPHLIPMSRGILSSCYTKPKPSIKIKDTKELNKLYKDFYKDEPFVRVVEKSPGTKHTWGSNFCMVYPVYDARTDRIVVISCLDNLVKGAAGQAIQNMNIMSGFKETTGLEGLALYP